MLGRSSSPRKQEAAKQSSHLVSQDISAANLLVKRELLNTQKALLDKVYEAISGDRRTP